MFYQNCWERTVLDLVRVPTKIGKQNSMTFPWLICFFPWLPFSHGCRYGYDCVSQHARQLQTRKLPQPREEAIPWLFHDLWEIFIFEDFSMTFHGNNFLQDFPGFSMTVGTLLVIKHYMLIPFVCSILTNHLMFKDLLFNLMPKHPVPLYFSGMYNMSFFINCSFSDHTNFWTAISTFGGVHTVTR